MSSRVFLSPIARADEAEFLAAAAASRKLHSPWVTPPPTSERFRVMVKRLQHPSNRGFVVRLRHTNALVGFVEITSIVGGNFRSAYLGYYVFAGHERQGLMREALRLAARTAFSEMKLHRLEANIQPENLASIALVKSCGFVKEGYSPGYLKIRGRRRDHERWAILAR